MGRLTSILLGLCSVISAPAQAPANHPAPAAPQPMAVPASLPPAAKPPAPAQPSAKLDPVAPSRYAGDDPSAYIATLAKRLTISSRTTDPFGQPQDPDAKPIIKPTVVKAQRRFTAEPPAALSDIVANIRVTTIMPKDKRFLVNDRWFGMGHKVPLNYRNKVIQTEIVEVSAQQIVFRNVDTGELGTLKLNLLPVGMTRGGTITAPGISPVNSNAPLEIDSPTNQSAGTVTP